MSPTYSATTAQPCGSGLAREGVRSGDIFIECPTAFASKLTPTGFYVARLFGDHRWIPVGAGLLAKASGQATSLLNAPPLSRASSLPQVLCRPPIRRSPLNPVGAGLLAKASGQATSLLDAPPLSRAGSLLQVCVSPTYLATTAGSCRSCGTLRSFDLDLKRSKDRSVP